MLLVAGLGLGLGLDLVDVAFSYLYASQTGCMHSWLLKSQYVDCLDFSGEYVGRNQLEAHETQEPRGNRKSICSLRVHPADYGHEHVELFGAEVRTL